MGLDRSSVRKSSLQPFLWCPESLARFFANPLFPPNGTSLAFPSLRQGWGGGGRELPLFRQLVGGEVHIALFVGFAVTIPATASEVRGLLRRAGLARSHRQLGVCGCMNSLCCSEEAFVCLM